MSEELIKQLLPLAAALVGAILAGGLSILKDYFSWKRKKLVCKSSTKWTLKK